MLYYYDTGPEAWRRAVQPDAMLSQTSQQQLSQSCTQSIQQAQVASQANEPVSHADTHSKATLLHQDQGVLAPVHCHQCIQT